MKKFILCTSLLLSILLLNNTLVTSNTDCDYENAVFAVRPENRNFLRYLKFENKFDSAVVNCTIGEFKVKLYNTELKIPIDSNEWEFPFIQGDTLQGEDQTLLSFSKTVPFIMPDSGKITFYRELMSYIPCNLDDNPYDGYDLGGTGDWRDNYWRVGRNTIKDKTEFVIKLINSTTQQIIAVIDSVGIDVNPNSRLAQRYGTFPDVMNREWNILPGFGGTSAYISISPRRWGPTPYGLVLKFPYSWVSYSTLFEYDSTGRNRCKEAGADSLSSRYFNEFINYCDSVKNATGWLPRGLTLMAFNEEMSLFYKDRYFEPIIGKSGDTIYVERTDAGFAKRSDIHSITQKSNKSGIAQIISVLPNPNSGDIARAILHSISDNVAIQLEIYSLNGEKIMSAWSGIVKVGETEITFSTSNLGTGTYIVVLKDKLGEIIDKYKLIIRR